MSHEEDFAIAYTNLQGPRNKDYIGTAKALQRLKSDPQYNTNSKLARHLPVSAEMVRQFLSLLTLPEKVQGLFGPNGLKLEHGRRLAQLADKGPDFQEEVAAAMVGMSAHDARDLVQFLLASNEVTFDEARRRVLDAKTKITREYHVVALLPDPEYRVLTQHARKKGMSVDELVTSVVHQWLLSQDENDE